MAADEMDLRFQFVNQRIDLLHDHRFGRSDIGDDGALYVSDWSNPLIGHMQHNIRDPSRDHSHGRIFRVTAIGRPLSQHVKIDGQPVPALLDNLKSKVDDIRYRTRIELSERPTAEVIGALAHWVHKFDAKKPEDAHHLLEALWLHQQFNVANQGLLENYYSHLNHMRATPQKRLNCIGH